MEYVKTWLLTTWNSLLLLVPLNGLEEVARLDFLVVAGDGGSVVGGSVGGLVWCTMGCVFTVVVTGAET